LKTRLPAAGGVLNVADKTVAASSVVVEEERVHFQPGSVAAGTLASSNRA
jgi:hypothetical protein